jgi:hypothetical protein
MKKRKEELINEKFIKEEKEKNNIESKEKRLYEILNIKKEVKKYL